MGMIPPASEVTMAASVAEYEAEEKVVGEGEVADEARLFL